MRQNVIILTAGLTGSSIVAGLLKDVGYWAGSETLAKPRYDTYENSELVAMNRLLLEQVGYHGRYDREFERRMIDQIADRAAGIELAPFRQFIERCHQFQPWVWKDPRFWLTIRFWARLLDLGNVRLLLVTRKHAQAWVSHTLHRQIQTPRHSRLYMDGVRTSLLEFIEEHRLPHLEIVFDDLLTAPADTLMGVSSFLGTQISLENLHHVYRGPLHRGKHGLVDYVRATLIYVKNYAERRQ